MIKPWAVVALVSLGASAAGTIYSIVSGRRYKKLCDRLNKSIDDLCNEDIEIDISSEVVDEIIERKVTEQLNASVPRVEQLVANKFSIALSDQVKREIGDAYKDIKPEVRQEIREQIGRLDIAEAKKEVLADAKDEAARLFREEYRYRMDEMVQTASEEIKDVVKRARTDISHVLDIHEMLSDFSKK